MRVNVNRFRSIYATTPCILSKVYVFRIDSSHVAAYLETAQLSETQASGNASLHGPKRKKQPRLPLLSARVAAHRACGNRLRNVYNLEHL
ncbi:MAG: hypothetical protein VB140_00160 [Burkholderia sp.]